MLENAIRAAVAAMICAGGAGAMSGGPPTRLTGAPGDAPEACTQCHGGTPNSGAGTVKIVFPDGGYKPGEKQRVKVEIADGGQRRWGFQLTARLASAPENAQAGDLSPADSFTQVVCERGGSAPCPAEAPVQFIMHTREGTRNGTAGGVTFEFDWTAPAADAGAVTFYAAANAASGDGTPFGDRIYTTSLLVEPAQAGAGGGIPTAIVRYIQRNLVADVEGAAERTDPKLVNPWGIALNGAGPLWVVNHRSGASRAYNGEGEGLPSGEPVEIRVPAAAGRAAAAPAAQVPNTTPAFEVAPGKPALLLFAAEDGTISGWNPEVDAGAAITVIDNSGAGAVYKGLALGTTGAGPALYAANFNGGSIDVFDATFRALATGGGFKDPELAAGLAPFNIRRIGRRLYVTYAVQDGDKRADVAGEGNGHINVFDMDGNLKQRLVSGGPLNSPWGLTPAPEFFGDHWYTLLVGNSGDGRINAFDLASGEFLGPLTDADGNAIAIEGLRALQFGNGREGGDGQTLYFTAGTSKGEHGLFGAIRQAP